MLRRNFAIPLVVTLLLATPVLAGPGVIIAPISATVDINGPGFGMIDDTFNQAGLTFTYTPGVTNFDDYMATNPEHTFLFTGYDFLGNPGTDTLQVTYDLGAVTTINALALWNDEFAGIGNLDLLTSDNGISFVSLASGLSPTDNAPGSDYLADIFAFGAVATRYVRFQASGCPQPNSGGLPACGIGEVAFRAAAVPEPSSWAMLIAGFGLVGAITRRRAAVIA